MQTRFATTSWTTVLAAQGASSTAARAALEVLCGVYWYPLYAFVRLQGHDAEEARDLTQAYFAELLEKDYLADYDPARGRFRAFLKVSVKNFLSKERDKAQAWKRGGRTRTFSLEAPDAEGRYRYEPVDRLTPEEIFERRWALTVLARALGRLREEQAEANRAKEFERLEGFLSGQGEGISYREAAGELETSESALRTTVHRLRRRFASLLREEVEGTVSSPQQVDDELKHLLRVVGPGGPSLP
ncbi:MAG TPA: sigma-70 family RNA polymerase sigma factor [Vicinamibacteria bacterium]|jgi:RNA polymerase sigma-70 factor (ECF subfamily)